MIGTNARIVGNPIVFLTRASTSLAKIASDTWDFVVLQDQSQYPAFSDAQVATDVYPYAEIL